MLGNSTPNFAMERWRKTEAVPKCNVNGWGGVGDTSWALKPNQLVALLTPRGRIILEIIAEVASGSVVYLVWRNYGLKPFSCAA